MFDLKQSQFIQWKNETLAATIDFPKNLVFGKQYPFIIICHGFIGSKVGVDRLFVKAAEEFTMDERLFFVLILPDVERVVETMEKRD